MRRKKCFMSRTTFLAVVSAVLFQCNLGSAMADPVYYDVDENARPTTAWCKFLSFFGVECGNIYVESTASPTSPAAMTIGPSSFNKAQRNHLLCELYLRTGKGLLGKRAVRCTEKGKPSKHPRIKKVLKLLVPNT